VKAAAPARHWAQINEVTFVAGIKFLFLVFRLFGRALFLPMLSVGVCFYFLAYPHARAASRDYLRRLYRDMGRPERDVTWWLVYRHFVSFGDSILDKLRVWSNAAGTVPVQWHHATLITDSIARGQGGLVVVSHLGNIEMGRGLSHTRPGLKRTVLVHTKHAEAFNRLLGEINPESALNLVQVTDMSPATAIALSEKVAAGEFLAIAGDRVPVSPTPRVAYSSFLGAPAAFPVGPFVLASLLQCPVYLAFCIRQDDGYHVYYELFRDQVKLPRRGRDAAFTVLAEAYAGRLAHYCRLAPLQWFNFYDFWAEPQSVRAGGTG
jgi:predicted LPLAT superfamily acyltransferase